jgi:hypothetical protein
MGIRLVCPQGHKLHVKAFLAGKRAICPHCGEKVLVPLANEAGASGSPAGRASDFAAVPETTIDLADVPTKGLATAGLSAGSSKAAPAVVPGATSTVSQGASARTSKAAAPALASAIPAVPPPVPPPAGAASDPISENAGAVWYVRPKSGGQYGPAPAAMMRQWVNESRVAADSLVWCEGWEQWRVARDVFVELGAGVLGAGVPGAAAVASLPVGGLVIRAATPGPAVATGPAVGTSPAGTVATTASVRYHARRRSTGRLLALIVVLGLLVVALAAVFIYVVQTKM